MLPRFPRFTTGMIWTAFSKTPLDPTVSPRHLGRLRSHDARDVLPVWFDSSSDDGAHRADSCPSNVRTVKYNNADLALGIVGEKRVYLSGMWLEGDEVPAYQRNVVTATNTVTGETVEREYYAVTSPEEENIFISRLISLVFVGIFGFILAVWLTMYVTE